MPDNIEEQRSTIIPETIELSSSEVAELFHRAYRQRNDKKEIFSRCGRVRFTYTFIIHVFAWTKKSSCKFILKYLGWDGSTQACVRH